MTNRLVPFLAFVLFLSFLASLSVRLFRTDPPPTGPTRTTLAAACEIPGRISTPGGEGLILRVALLQMARHGDITAVADVNDVAVDPGVLTHIPIVLTRALLPEFEGARLNGLVHARVDPAENGLAILRLHSTRLRLGTMFGPAYRERWVVKPGEPVVRLGYAHTGALAVILLPAAEARTSDPGTLAWWRDRFRQAGTLPFPDETEVAAAAEEHRPEKIVRPWAAPAAAPLNAALGLWILGDAEGLQALRERARTETGFLASAFASMARERPDEEWVRTESLFALQLLQQMTFHDSQVQDLLDQRMEPGINYTAGGWILRRSPPARILRMLDDPTAEGVANRVLANMARNQGPVPERLIDYEIDLSHDIGRYALEHEPPSDRPSVVATWEGLRKDYLDRLPRTVRLRHSQPGLLAFLLLAMAAVSVAAALIRRGRRTAMSMTTGPLVFLYALTVAGQFGFTVGHYLAPAWFAVFLLWHWSDVEHPWWERVAIGIALFSSLVRIVFQDQVDVIHPAFLTIADAWFGFAWLVLGRVVLAMPDHRDSRAFRAFLTLHVFSVVQVTGALLLNQVDQSRIAIHTTIGVAAAAFLWFSLEEPVRRLGARLRRN